MKNVLTVGPGPTGAIKVTESVVLAESAGALIAERKRSAEGRDRSLQSLGTERLLGDKSEILHTLGAIRHIIEKRRVRWFHVYMLVSVNAPACTSWFVRQGYAGAQAR